MAGTDRRASPSLIDELYREAHRFDFFQAVRLLECLARQRPAPDPQSASPQVGRDGPPEREAVRFRTIASLRFPPGSITQLVPPKPAGPRPDGQPAPSEMSVAFLGLTGPIGVLPQHYTRTMLHRVQQKDYSLRDFLDLFHHRLISLFYRAWEKYRFPIAYERRRSAAEPRESDLFTHCLFCLVGLGTPHLLRRLYVDDETFLFYAGHFAHYPRNALSLERIAGDYLELPVQVEQLQGQWLYLSDADRSRLPSRACTTGQNNALGFNLIAGERVWDVQSKFRVRIGPLSYQQFERLMPTGTALARLCQLTRMYVGPELDFDVQPVLRRSEAPWFRLGGEGTQPRLGWNTWLRSGELERDPDDVIFFLDDV